MGRDLSVSADRRVPSEFFGVWRRESLRVEGQLVTEDWNVVWIQVGQRFADLRVRGEQATAPEMAAWGHTTWDGQALQWHATASFGIPGDSPDIGRVSWDDDVLVEVGTFELGGQEVSYTERWVRLPTEPGPRDVLDLVGWPGDAHHRARGTLAVWGRYALVLIDRTPASRPDPTGPPAFSGCFARRENASWTTVFGTADAVLPTLPETTTFHAGDIVPLTGTVTSTWQVVDTGP